MEDGSLPGGTGRDQVGEALRKSEERFRQVVEYSPSAMVMVSTDGLIEMVNAQAEKVFGYARAELLGKPLEMLVPARFRGHHPGMRASFHAEPSSRPMGAGRDLFALRRDGSEFPVEIGLNPIRTDEGMKVLSVIVDISDRKAEEERIRASLKEKEMLLGEIHHRVKNNLQIIDSLLDLQSARVQDPASLAMLRDSQNRIRSMAFIHQMLYQSRDFAQVDFSQFLESLVPVLVSSYGVDPNHINLFIDAVEVFLPINAAIPCGLVVNELISNALKHAFPEGRGGEIRIELKRGGNDTAYLAISDDGVGIPEDLVFEETSTLGLQLVMHLADQLGGEMTVKRSNPTTFALRFPTHR
jgi:PAS domain S-box-containing protein